VPSHASLEAAKQEFGLVGNAPSLNELVAKILKLSGDSSPILITGESGTGKELVARAVHSVSRRKDETFLTVDAATLVGSLMESELFGHVKGAFTDARQDKLGLVRSAAGGTLFLDEVGELPAEIQAKLLRLLQEGEVRPIGAAKAVKVDVRILAATNRDLKSDVRNGRFRKDLYYRLNVIPIRLDPLRERKEDIPALVNHFAAKYSLDEIRLSRETRDLMTEYDWPGNVRELENAVRRIVALKSNPIVNVEDLPSPLRNLAETRVDSTAAAPEVVPLAEVERRHILKTVRYTKNDMNAAAHLLGIGRTTLYRKMKAYRRRDEIQDAERMQRAQGWAAEGGR